MLVNIKIAATERYKITRFVNSDDSYKQKVFYLFEVLLEISFFSFSSPEGFFHFSENYQLRNILNIDKIIDNNIRIVLEISLSIYLSTHSPDTNFCQISSSLPFLLQGHTFMVTYTIKALTSCLCPSHSLSYPEVRCGISLPANCASLGHMYIHT